MSGYLFNNLIVSVVLLLKHNCGKILLILGRYINLVFFFKKNSIFGSKSVENKTELKEWK